MKQKTFIMAIMAMALVMASCAKHDFFDEDTITGKVGPEAYWEVGSAVVPAGGSMDFSAQYYSSASTIDHSEVWYDVEETLDKTVTCPWTVTFTYTLSSNITQQKRVSQLIKEYAHAEEMWDDSLHAYYLTDAFPVSGTLAPFEWKQPAQFDSTKMEQYFGPTYMQEFKDAVHAKMQYADYKKMYVGMGKLDDFRQYTDSTEDKNQGEGVYVYHFPKNDAGEEVVPYAMDSIWETIGFAELIENAANGYYEVEYKRSYALNAILRVYDIRGVYGRTVSKHIDIN
ncbi:MAG: hypothetical protein J6T76_05205 [Paludibacteraceae bacterium]|jgi:hypothetical protein|nr:hypothetical protein [Paludibacteraceae bacterium]